MANTASLSAYRSQSTLPSTRSTREPSTFASMSSCNQCSREDASFRRVDAEVEGTYCRDPAISSVVYRECVEVGVGIGVGDEGIRRLTSMEGRP